MTGRYTQTSTTLADLFTPLLFADLSSAVRTSLKSWLNDEFADGPGFVPRKMLLAHILDPLRWPIGGPHANRGEASFQPALGAVSPAHILPLGIGQHVFGRPRQDIRNVPLARPAPAGNRPDQVYADR